jgi:hypothetical protein
MTKKYPITESGDLVVSKPAPQFSTKFLTQVIRLLYRNLCVVVPLFPVMYARYQLYRNGDLSGTQICLKNVLMMGHMNIAQKGSLALVLNSYHTIPGRNT